MLQLTTFYRSGAHRSDVYKWDAFVTSRRFYNRAWQPQRHDRLPETSGTLWIHRGALTNQRCSLATGCGIKLKRYDGYRSVTYSSNIMKCGIMRHVHVKIGEYEHVFNNNGSPAIKFYSLSKFLDLLCHTCIHTYKHTCTLENNVVTPWNEVPFWRLSILHLLLGFEGKLDDRMHVFLCIVCTILFYVYFDKFVMTFIDIWEISRMSIPKFYWMVIVVNLVKQILFFAWCCLLVWFCVCRVNTGYSRL